MEKTVLLILSFESSCDETACAVLEMTEKKRSVLADIVASQIDIHKRYGGVVPEIASRAHTEALSRITGEALSQSGVKLGDIDAVAVTNGPGLIGALLCGVSFAKALAYSNGLPLVPVCLMRAHVAAAYLSNPTLTPPFLALTVSGGHTSLSSVAGYTSFDEIGSTRDDAAGEAFDKVGRIIGLPYPAGAAIDALASEGDPTAITFPSPAVNDDSLDFSFSGLKTAAINYINTEKQRGREINRADVAASFTAAVVNGIVKKTGEALKRTRCEKLVLAGGVAANSHLRSALAKKCGELGVEFYTPELRYCGDNGAMVGAQGYYEFLDGVRASTGLNAYPN